MPKDSCCPQCKGRIAPVFAEGSMDLVGARCIDPKCGWAVEAVEVTAPPRLRLITTAREVLEVD